MENISTKSSQESKSTPKFTIKIITEIQTETKSSLNILSQIPPCLHLFEKLNLQQGEMQKNLKKNKPKTYKNSLLDEALSAVKGLQFVADDLVSQAGLFEKSLTNDKISYENIKRIEDKLTAFEELNNRKNIDSDGVCSWICSIS
ncbi:hypothetical protein SteCoe_24172 [Stentor coeruleus]|uniref:Uncharacterized protein n=1 Tax=Stentor coeruleus TaxID=5963 RepID=A0A1R2BIB4_9CILI|nr:hypothetical protein SteCoe_24172 [Stentor coeruleus]